MRPGFALARPRRSRRWTAWGSTVVLPPRSARPSSSVQFGVRWRAERRETKRVPKRSAIMLRGGLRPR
eukprot:8746002-Pyramimonas_sp.AAC.1